MPMVIKLMNIKLTGSSVTMLSTKAISDPKRIVSVSAAANPAKKSL